MRAPPAGERSSALRSARPRTLSIGVGLALVLHVLGLVLVAGLARELAPRAAVAPPQAAPSELSFELAPPAAAEAAAGTAARQSEAAAGAPAASSAARLALLPPRAAVTPAPAGAAPGSEPPAAEEEGGGVSQPRAAGSPEAPPGGAGKPLSLEALGVGPKQNPFLAPSGRRSGSAALGAHIDHVLRDGLAKHDQELGLGPEGPVVAAVTELVMQSTSAPNTNALLLLRTDGSGETVHVEVAEASSDTDAWNAIAAALKQALRGKKLRVPAGGGGVTLQLRVESREELPSGRDPGLAIELFGQEVKSGAGDRSTRLQLLTPKVVLEQYQVSSSDPHAQIPVVGFQFTVLGVNGDPVDIAAAARRVVHAHLVSLKTHERPEQP